MKKIIPNSQNHQIFPIVYANQGLRFVAVLINTVLLWVFCFLPLSVLGKEHPELILLSCILYFAMQIYFMYKHQRTLGKKFTHLLVVDYTTLQPLGIGRYILREVVEIIGNQFGLGIINAICAFINKERRTVTDIMFSTIVISTK